MKNVLPVLAILFATCAPASAQTGVTGTWQVESTPPWTIELRVDGPRLTGTVSSCSSRASRIEIFEGSTNGNTFAFKCKSLDGDRTITVTGTIDRAGIMLTWEKQVRNGGFPGADELMFGASAPRSYTARRVTEAATDETPGVELVAAANLRQKDVKVEGTLFLPTKVSRVRAVIVAINWGLGEPVYRDGQVRRLLETTESAFLLAGISRIATGTDSITVVDDAALGGADGLLMLLRDLAEESGHRELTDARLLFWGHSAAGPFGTTFAAMHPDRTIAFVRYHSRERNKPVDLSIAKHIPALLLAGGKDTNAGVDDAETLWKSGRSVGAPWTFVVEPDAPHGSEEYLKKANDLVIPWIAAVLRQRLSPDGATLRAVTDGSAWMGNNRTGDIASAETFSGSKAEASWLPDELTSRGWRIVMGAAK